MGKAVSKTALHLALVSAVIPTVAEGSRRQTTRQWVGIEAMGKAVSKTAHHHFSSRIRVA